MSAKEMWQAQGDIPGARAILESAFEQNPDSESIFLAAAKLFAETGEMEAAQQILQKAQVQADTERVSTCASHVSFADHLQIWMKSAALERQLGKYEDALKTLDTAISKFPQFAKFYMMRGQILQDNMSDVSGAREAYAKGVKACPKSVPLWILSARLEENAQVVIKARALLERARLLNPKKQIPNSKDFDTTDVERLWAEAIKLEERHGGPTQAKGVLARGAWQP
jgi:pre-mRNA-processing factor 6